MAAYVAHCLTEPQVFLVDPATHRPYPRKWTRDAAGESVQRRLHVMVAEKALGRPLPAAAEVHHVNGDRQDYRATNLVICENHAYHYLLHVRARIVRAGGDPDTQQICGICRAVKNLDAFGIDRSRVNGRHVWCVPCRRGKKAKKVQP